jgi:NADPH2:quinone reductase
MTRAIRIHENGGPEVMRWEEIELPPPSAGEVRVRHTAVAVNFSDVNVRRGGFYISRPQTFPLVPGNEAAGIVTAVGAGVAAERQGERVAYVGTGGPFYEDTGSYAEERNVPADCLVRLPRGISERTAAAFLLKGLTAAMIVKRVFRPGPEDTVLVHAAASGVGLLLCQWSKHLGARVIGTAGSAEKARVARAHGCDHVLLYADFPSEVSKLAPRGVSAVFDGVGRDTFERSIACVRRFGMLVNYGNASGHVPPLDLLLLAKHGSLSVSRPGFSHYVAECGGLAPACTELFELVLRGVLKVDAFRSYPLSDAQAAHRDLEARQLTGSAVLIP